jgi:hypothetical protein
LVREVTKIKKIILVMVFLTLAILMLTIAVTPARAENPKKLPVTVVRTGVTFTQGDYWYTEGNTFHVRDALAGINTYTITGDGISLIGSGPNTVYNGNLNLDTGIGQQVFHSELVFPGGTFVGTVTTHGEMYIYPGPNTALIGYLALRNGDFKGVWHGTGDYQGWTYLLEYTVVNGVAPSPLRGYVLIP